MSIGIGFQSSFSDVSRTETGATVVIAALEGKKFKALHPELGVMLSITLEDVAGAKKFSFEKGKTLHLAAPQAGIRDVFLVGLGKSESFDAKAAEEAGATIRKLTEGERASHVEIHVDRSVPQGMAAQMAFGMLLDSYRFDKYLTRQPEDKKPSLKSASFVVADPEVEEKAFAPLKELAAGVSLARDLVNEPANVINPVSFAERVMLELKPYEGAGLRSYYLTEDEMRREGMQSMLAVSQGSKNEARLLVVEYDGVPQDASKKDQAPLLLVGKGITFDSGGLSIKPAAGMEAMKADMGGAAAVAGTMRSLAATQAPVKVVGIMALAENMPSDRSYRPGDIIGTMSGQTVEVLNTDAEGRLVLNDAMWFGQTKYKPRAVIDLATLTGAIVSALGDAYAGLFSNDDKLVAVLERSAQATGDKVWRMPWKDFDKLMDSPNADMKNSGGPKAGSGSAAAFLHRYVTKTEAGVETPWAHLDIAGTGIDMAKRQGTGWGVRLLDHFARSAQKPEKKKAKPTHGKKPARQLRG